MNTSFSQRKDMTGEVFGKLQVLHYSHTDKSMAYWTCMCNCGNIVLIRGTALRSGNTKSCGCFRSENGAARKRLHAEVDGVECKWCYKCEDWISIKEFSKGDRWDGLQSSCKPCVAKGRNKDRTNRRPYMNNWTKNKYWTDPNYKIKSCVQARIRQALKNNWKAFGTSELIGCSIQYLRNWLENSFDENMTWENHGRYWHIDHIIPCAKFDLSNPEQQKECFHYTNLQPLTAIENVRKGDRV